MYIIFYNTFIFHTIILLLTLHMIIQTYLQFCIKSLMAYQWGWVPYAKYVLYYYLYLTYHVPECCFRLTNVQCVNIANLYSAYQTLSSEL